MTLTPKMDFKKVSRILFCALLATTLTITVHSILAAKEVTLFGNEINRWGPSDIPVDEPSYLIGGFGSFYPQKDEHKYLGGLLMTVEIDGESVKLKRWFTGSKDGFARQWYAQFEAYHFSPGTHNIKTVWYQLHEPTLTIETTFTVIP